MIAMLVIGLLATYGLTTILAHLMIRWNPYYKQNDDELHVHLHVYNSETCLEGAIRSLVHLSRIQGRPLHMIVYDYGSTDSTAQILGTLQKETPFLFDQVEVVTSGQISWVSVDQEVVVTPSFMTIDLRQGFGSGTIQTI